MDRIHPQVTEILLRQPETGMGWQLVEVVTPSGAADTVRVLNAEFLSSGVTSNLARESRSLEPRAPIRAALIEGRANTKVRALTRSQAVERGLLLERKYGQRGQPASEADPELSKLDEEFRRFSAFENDRRIAGDGSLLAGTYATTAVDAYLHIRTGMDAVRRYALPNPDPAVHRFWLRPHVQLKVQRGIAQPAYEQPGGGAEVIFVNGAPSRTSYKQDTIPGA